MSHACPSEDEWIALLDGEATENHAATLRAHLARCAACNEVWTSLTGLRRAIAAPLPDLPEAATVQRILARIEAVPAPVAAPPRPAPRLRITIAVAFAAVAVAASLALVPRLAADRDGGTFSARGSKSERSLHRDVGVTVYRGRDHLVPLQGGDLVDDATAYSASYRNLGAAGARSLMVFAVDAAGVVHWIHPAYLDARDDPGSVPLDHAISDTLLPSGAVLSGPASGPLRVVTLVAARPLRVSQIEALSAPELSLAALRTHFPDAEIAEIEVVVRPPRQPEQNP